MNAIGKYNAKSAAIARQLDRLPAQAVTLRMVCDMQKEVADLCKTVTELRAIVIEINSRWDPADPNSKCPTLEETYNAYKAKRDLLRNRGEWDSDPMREFYANDEGDNEAAPAMYGL